MQFMWQSLNLNKICQAKTVTRNTLTTAINMPSKRAITLYYITSKF